MLEFASVCGEREARRGLNGYSEKFWRTVNPILSLLLIIDLDLILVVQNHRLYLISAHLTTLKLIQPIIGIRGIQGGIREQSC